MAIRADKGHAGHAEAFQMHLMADAVAGTGEANTVFFCHRLNIAVIVGILKARLKRVMVDISDRKLSADTGNADGFKLKICHRACGVLCQRLVYTEGNFVARLHFTLKKVCFYNFLCNGKSHNVSLFEC